MRTRFWQALLGVAAAFALFGALLPAYGQEQPREVGTNEQIQFEQEKARAHMRELEERMFRLANLIREAQPDDAARMLMGVRKAREELIADRMAQVSSLVGSLKLEQALTEQKEVLAALESLKQLLLTGDIDLELKLEQLRKLQEAGGHLQQLIRKEQAQQRQTGQLADSRDPSDFEALKAGEQRNQRAGEDLQELLKTLGSAASGAAGSVGGACQSMGQASRQLAAAKATEAGKEQADALKKLREAEESLAEAEAQLRKEIEALARQRVMESLSEMLALQTQVRETTEKLALRVAEKNRQALLSLRRLAETEDRIIALAARSIELCELTQFSMALPAALAAVRDQMVEVSAMLRSARADDQVVAAEKQIEADLQALLEALQQASRPSSAMGGGQCQGCGGNLNKLLAEVKMLRWMQNSLHMRTRELDRLHAAATIDARERDDRAQPLGARQRELQGITGRLHEMTCPHCLAE